MRASVYLTSLLVLLSVGSASAAQPVSLAGNWRFALDRENVGENQRWFSRNLSDPINLPGALQSQGYGDEISIETPWVLSLYDRNWFLREDYQAYTNAGRVKVPFVCQPPRHYLGAAWYQRDLDIPADWKGRRVVLFLERPHWETRVWFDDQLIGTNNSLCAPHEYDLGLVTPGKHRLSVRVDNRLILPYRPDAHAVSDSLNSTWNGIVGTLELRSTPLVWVEDLQVFPRLEARSVVVRGQLRKTTPGTVSHALGFVVLNRFDARPRFPVTNINVQCASPSQAFEVEVKLPPDLKLEPWDEFHPNLFELSAFSGELPYQERKNVIFGFREFKRDGRDLVINGQKTYMRGTHHGGDFPLTGYPPTDVEYWRKLFLTCKEWGLNHMRFHSFCPPDAAFEAADQVGFYLQPEPGMWNTFDVGSPMEKMLYAETERMLKAYGNHPSFVMFSPSNEPKGRWRNVLPQWAEHFRNLDSRRLYTTGTGFTDTDAPGPMDRVDFSATQRFGSARVRGEQAWFGRDYSRSLRNVNVPVVAHELGQWCAYPDYEVIKKFTGYMRPGNYEIFRDSMAAHGLLEKNKDFAWASGRFQLACYKEEVEANLRTPGLAGFQLLDLHEYVGQGTALVGLLDPFWEEKDYVKAAEWRQFCHTTVPLARLRQRVFTTDEKLEADVELAHYGEKPLENCYSAWAILSVGESSQSSILATGTWTNGNIPIGKGFALGKISAELAKLPAPGAYKLMIGLASSSTQPPSSGWVEIMRRSVGGRHIDLGGQTLESVNEWNFWVYPSQVSNTVSETVLVTSSWEDAEAKLNAGGKVLYLPRNADLDWSSPPLDSVPVFWNRLMNPAWGRMFGLWCDTNHPALAGFPTEANCDWQWTQIVRGVRPVNLDRLPRGLQPIVQGIDDWNRNWKLGAIFECKVSQGKLMVCSFDLANDMNNRPVARQLRKSLLDYMAGDQFQPKTDVSISEFKTVLFDSRIMRKLNASVSAAGPDVNAVIDGDPNTYWSVGTPVRGVSSTRHPYELTITFPAAVAMNGLVIMPRQNDRDHTGDVKSFAIHVSDNGQAWREVKRGELPSSWTPQRVNFGETITTKQVKFTALSGYGKDPSAALAELAVMYAGPKLSGGPLETMEYGRSRSTSSDVDEGGDVPASRTNAVPRNP